MSDVPIEIQVWVYVGIIVFVVGAIWAGVTCDDWDDAIMHGLMSVITAMIWPVFAILGPPVLLGKALRKAYHIRKDAATQQRRAEITREERIERDYQDVVRMVAK